MNYEGKQILFLVLIFCTCLRINCQDDDPSEEPPTETGSEDPPTEAGSEDPPTDREDTTLSEDLSSSDDPTTGEVSEMPPGGDETTEGGDHQNTEPPPVDETTEGGSDVTEATPPHEDTTPAGNGDDTTPAENGDDTTTSTPDSGDEMKTCGGVLASLTGTISYKLGDVFDNNERCTWIIYAADASVITFTLEENGLIQKMEDTIKVGYFQIANFNKLNNYKESVLSAFDINKTATVEGPLAFVRFFTDTKIRGMGFKISYSATNIITTSTNPRQYTNQFFTSDYGVIKHTSTSPNERSTFNLKPTVDIVLSLKYFNGNCMGYGVVRDSLTVFKWGRSSRQELLQEFCTSPITSVVNWRVSAMEEVLITFMTNTANITNELRFVWAPI